MIGYQTNVTIGIRRVHTTPHNPPHSSIRSQMSRSVGPGRILFQRFQTIRLWWWWEIGAAFLSTTCILLIFVTLLTMHGKPLNNWKLSISINATVSILATVARSTLMLLVAQTIGQMKWHHYDSVQSLKDIQTFDAASRGPWGALVFLVHARGRALLATTAALIVIAALGYEPAAQQMLSFPLRSVVVETSESVAQVYQAFGFNTTDLVALGTQYTDFYPPNSLQVALMNSFAGVVNGAAQSCPAPRCTFGTVNTLGICEQCRDATNEVQHIRNSTGAGGGTDENGEDLYQHYSDYFIPEDKFYPAATSFFANHGGGAPLAPFLVTANLTSSMDTPDLGNRRAGFMAVNHTSLTGGTADSTVICDFSWCVRTLHEAEIVNGLFRFAQEERSPVDLTNFNDADFPNSFFAMRSEKFPDRQFVIDQLVEFALWQYITATLRGDSSSNSLVRMMAGRPMETTAEAMAMAATNWLRGPANNRSEELRGEAIESVTFVHVRWAWLAWPAVLTLAGSVVLFGCVLRDHRRNDLYRSSALALLFHGLHGVDENDLKVHYRGRVEEDSALESAAEKLRVKLGLDESGTLKLMKQ